jgi:DNA-binding NarL/FixJ family response regulator
MRSAAKLAGARFVVLQGALGMSEDDISHLNGLDYARDTAQAREQAGVSLLNAGRVQAGTVQLRTALVSYQRLSATWDLDRAASTARRHDVAVPARHRRGRRGYGSGLSPRQRDVAELAASGRTNQEIAEELFVSVKTVEQHMTVVLRKLGVTSRRAIARQLATGVQHTTRR